MTSKSNTNLSLIEAVEALSNIADLEFDRDTGISQKHEVVLDNQLVNYRTIHWLHQQDANFRDAFCHAGLASGKFGA